MGGGGVVGAGASPLLLALHSQPAVAARHSPLAGIHSALPVPQLPRQGTQQQMPR
jgi:hypothetical protein